jgi:hypothetical protein
MKSQQPDQAVNPNVGLEKKESRRLIPHICCGISPDHLTSSGLEAKEKRRWVRWSCF